MYIRELELKHFGKFTDQRIELEPGINLIYGENESGKTTIHTFIRAMLFGLSRQRGRAAQSDLYKNCEPWENPAYYAGVIRFVSGGKLFRLSRSFSRTERRAELVCETDGEELSLEHGDLDMLLNGLTENRFLHTISIAQLKSGTEEGLADELRNYMANYEETGDSRLDVSDTIRYLKEIRRDLNRKNKEIQTQLEQRREQTRMKKELMEQELAELEQKAADLERQISSFPRKGPSSLEEQGVPAPKRADRSAAQNAIRQKETSKQRVSRRIGYSLLAVLAACAAAFLLPDLWEKAIAIFLISGMTTLFLYLDIKKRRAKPAAPKIEVEPIHPPENSQSDSRELGEANLRYYRQRLSEEIRERKLQIEAIDTAELPDTELDKERTSIQTKTEAVDLAASTLYQLSGEMHQGVGEQIEQSVSRILSQLTQGRYTRVRLDAQLRLRIHTPDRILSPQELSRGTLDQIYFSFRMAAAQLFFRGEPMPCLYDETFALYDTPRLKAALTWLSQTPGQHLIFTCHKREEQLLKELQIPHHKITLPPSLLPPSSIHTFSQ